MDQGVVPGYAVPPRQEGRPMSDDEVARAVATGYLQPTYEQPAPVLQPGYGPGTVMPVHQGAYMQGGYREWGTGLCDCSSGEAWICCMGFWGCGCSQYLFARNVERAGLGTLGPNCAIMCCLTFVTTATSCVVFELTGVNIQIAAGITTVAATCYEGQMRYKMRKKFGLVGKHCRCGRACGDAERTDDICAAFWCMPCAVCQDTRMLELYGIDEGEAKLVAAGQEVQMVPPPQMPPMTAAEGTPRGGGALPMVG